MSGEQSDLLQRVDCQSNSTARSLLITLATSSNENGPDLSATVDLLQFGIAAIIPPP